MLYPNKEIKILRVCLVFYGLSLKLTILKSVTGR